MKTFDVEWEGVVYTFEDRPKRLTVDILAELLPGTVKTTKLWADPAEWQRLQDFQKEQERKVFGK